MTGVFSDVLRILEIVIAMDMEISCVSNNERRVQRRVSIAEDIFQLMDI